MIRPKNETHYSRHLLMMLDTAEMKDSVAGNDNPPIRFKRWLFESLLCALADLESGDAVLAFRSILAAREYLGRIGGFYPTPVSHDCAIHVQQEIERCLRREG